MSAATTKAGIISCSGEAIPEGTLSRLATRRVLELLVTGHSRPLPAPPSKAQRSTPPGGCSGDILMWSDPMKATCFAPGLCVKVNAQRGGGRSGTVHRVRRAQEVLGVCGGG
jgi:hypothetical protein